MIEEDAEQEINLGKLPSYLGYQIRQAQGAVFRDFTSITEQVGVTPGEFSLLTIVAANPGINQNQLAYIHGLDKSTLSWAVKKLKDRGLVVTERKAHDRRHFSLALTLTGIQVLKNATKMVEDQESVMDEALEAGEREKLLRLLKKLTGAFALK